MKISINNYEAYLIDYMDGRLNSAEIQQLKAFCVQNHIDFEELTEDLPVLENTDDTFDEKEYLFKNKIVPFGNINEDNYEERFIAYQELILDGEEEREVPALVRHRAAEGGDDEGSARFPAPGRKPQRLGEELQGRNLDGRGELV